MSKISFPFRADSSSRPEGHRAAISHTLLYRALIASASWAGPSILAKAWDGAWGRTTPCMHGYTTLKIHGHTVYVNAGYAYPAFRRRWSTYNDPLVQLVHETSRGRNDPLVFVDVGAAVGDTVLLVAERCGSTIGHYVCFEPDEEFFTYLQANLGERSDVTLCSEMLSDDERPVPSLVRTHSGTASAQGRETRPAVTIDSALGGMHVDVLKVDTDGYDGKVLAGAMGLLSDSRPSVIFEWHPILIERTGQDRHAPFKVLQACGYESFVWFTKHGHFSHIQHGYVPATIDALAQVCLVGGGPLPDWHFDVVALPKESSVDVISVGRLHYARTSRFA